MKITTITAHAGRTFNHPYEQYSNFRPGISLTAEVAGDADKLEKIRKLQTLAEYLADEVKADMLARLKAEEAARQKASLEASRKARSPHEFVVDPDDPSSEWCALCDQRKSDPLHGEPADSDEPDDDEPLGVAAEIDGSDLEDPDDNPHSQD